jgi:hypothetical protein
VQCYYTKWFREVLQLESQRKYPSEKCNSIIGIVKFLIKSGVVLYRYKMVNSAVWGKYEVNWNNVSIDKAG